MLRLFFSLSQPALQSYIKCGARRIEAARDGRTEAATVARWAEVARDRIVAKASSNSIDDKIRLGCPFIVISFKVVYIF